MNVVKKILIAISLSGFGVTVFADSTPSITVVSKKAILREIVEVQLKPINCKVIGSAIVVGSFHCTLDLRELGLEKWFLSIQPIDQEYNFANSISVDVDFSEAFANPERPTLVISKRPNDLRSTEQFQSDFINEKYKTRLIFETDLK